VVEMGMQPIELAERLALLLALTLFLGLAFEEIYKCDEPAIPGGIRTFPLVGLAGASTSSCGISRTRPCICSRAPISSTAATVAPTVTQAG
jgi:hypothetical protein